MFVEQALKQLVDLSANIRVLDVSAAPGGKSTHIASLLSAQSLLVCNEVIRSRSHILTDNIIKWGLPNLMVTNNDPAAFKGLTSFFDVIVVDAPCSGSGLFRKDADAMNEWSLNNVALCSERQQRILANVIPALKPGGILIYSTCSYSVEEDEAICDWLIDGFEVSSEALTIPKAWGIVESASAKHSAHGYRFYPDQVKGEGLFLACFRKNDGDNPTKLRPAKAAIVSSSEALVLQPWIKDDNRVFIKDNNEITAIPSSIVEDYLSLKPVLNVHYSGTIMGTLMKGNKLVPHHSLALSTCIADTITNLELTYEDSIRYLQRQDLKLMSSVSGWQTVSYLQHRLGWINALPNRINNYYPKEMRILKQTDPTVADTAQTKEGQEP
jgi:NOL1/NOP2/fmu family ribosome biogenesis protein